MTRVQTGQCGAAVHAHWAPPESALIAARLLSGAGGPARVQSLAGTTPERLSSRGRERHLFAVASRFLHCVSAHFLKQSLESLREPSAVRVQQVRRTKKREAR